MPDSLDARQRRRDNAPSKDQAPQGSFKNYKDVPGKPGFFDDGFGHLMYDSTDPRLKNPVKL